MILPMTVLEPSEIIRPTNTEIPWNTPESAPRQVWINHDYHKSVEQEPYYGKSAWSSRSRNRLFSLSQSQSPLPDNANLLSHT